MIALPSLDLAEAEVLAHTKKLLAAVRRHSAVEPGSIPEAISTLALLRKETYEDLNQIQHEYFIIQGARWLLKSGVVRPDVSWSWNPRQTGTATEPDLGADADGRRIISAEVTTSVIPQGKIDERMRLTLTKLSTMPGEKYYFVCSAAMLQRAQTKIAKQGWNIRTVYLDSPP